MGEAASRVSENLRIAHDEIQWRHIVGMRNRIIHAYFEIELDLVWKTVTEELPILIPRLEAIRKELETQTR